VHRTSVSGCLGLNFVQQRLIFQYNYCSPFVQQHVSMYHFTCTKQKMPDCGEVHRSQHDHSSSIWNWLNVIPLAPEFRGGI
jgi:hypothetical protein